MRVHVSHDRRLQEQESFRHMQSCDCVYESDSQVTGRRVAYRLNHHDISPSVKSQQMGRWKHLDQGLWTPPPLGKVWHIHWAPETFLDRKPGRIVVTVLLAGTKPKRMVSPSLQETRGKHLLSADETQEQLPRNKCIHVLESDADLSQQQAMLIILTGQHQSDLLTVFLYY